MQRYITQATPNSELCIMIFLPAVWRITAVSGELGGVSALRLGPDGVGVGTDGSVTIKVEPKYTNQCSY